MSYSLTGNFESETNDIWLMLMALELVFLVQILRCPEFCFGRRPALIYCSLMVLVCGIYRLYKGWDNRIVQFDISKNTHTNDLKYKKSVWPLNCIF